MYGGEELDGGEDSCDMKTLCSRPSRRSLILLPEQISIFIVPKYSVLRLTIISLCVAVLNSPSLGDISYM
jgi:hypothetical protein